MIDDLVLLSTSAAIVMILFRAMTLDRLLPWFTPIPATDSAAETKPSPAGTGRERRIGRPASESVSGPARSSTVSGWRMRR